MYKKAIETLKKCYIGLDSDNNHTVDPSILGDDLHFSIALTQVDMAIKQGKITQGAFHLLLSEDHRKLQ